MNRTTARATLCSSWSNEPVVGPVYGWGTSFHVWPPSDDASSAAADTQLVFPGHVSPKSAANIVPLVAMARADAVATPVADSLHVEHVLVGSIRPRQRHT
jgi:hypothetical protein